MKIEQRKKKREERQIGALLFTPFAIQFRIQKTKRYLHKQLQPDPILKIDTISGTKIVHEIVCSNIQQKSFGGSVCQFILCVLLRRQQTTTTTITTTTTTTTTTKKIPVLCVTKYISNNYTIQNEQGMANSENKNKTNILYSQIVCMRYYFENKTPKTLSLSI